MGLLFYFYKNNWTRYKTFYVFVYYSTRTNLKYKPASPLSAFKITEIRMNIKNFTIALNDIYL